MSERYEHDYSGKLFGAYSIFDGDLEIGPSTVIEMLNDRGRLAAQVATLRELLVEARRRIVYADDIDLGKRIDAALADTETTG